MIAAESRKAYFTTEAPRGCAATKIKTDIITTKVAKHALSNAEGITKEEIEM